MLEVRSLESTGLDAIIACFSEAFKEYPFQFPPETQYWEDRFHRMQVDLRLSYGVFDADRLVAFVLNGIGIFNGTYTAYNSGTGVLAEYRGRHLVDMIYHDSRDQLIGAGVEMYLLEVLCENHRAIAAYERVGFSKTRVLSMYKGVGGKVLSGNTQVEPVALDVFTKFEGNDASYSWEATNARLTHAPQAVDVYQVLHDGHQVGGFVTLRGTDKVLRLHALTGHEETLVRAICSRSEELRISNLDAGRVSLVQVLLRSGFMHIVDQFEMVLKLG